MSGERKGLFASYLKHLERRGCSPATVRLYSVCLAKFEEWMRENGRKEITHLATEDLWAWQVWLSQVHSKRGREYAKAHQAAHIAAIRSFFAYLRGEMLIVTDPAAKLRPPRQPKRLHRDILTPAELRELLAAPDDSPLGMRDRVMLRLLALSGLRASELVNLDVDSADLPEREIMVRKGKGAKDRLVFFDAGTRTELARYLAHSRPQLAAREESALLVTNRGRRMHTVTALRTVATRARQAGIGRRLTCHSLRRTFCTLMHRHGANIKVIGELAGHESLATTARYTQVDIEDLTRVYLEAHPRSRNAQGDT